MFHTVSDFCREWEYEAQKTKDMLELLGDSWAYTPVHGDVRMAARLAWHIALTPVEMLTAAQLPLDNVPHPETELPKESLAIQKAYDIVSEAVRKMISGLPDSTLLEDRNMYGETWTVGQTLYYMILHQSHHRGQMSVILRIQGQKVSGAYGPAREEWAAMGLEPMQ